LDGTVGVYHSGIPNIALVGGKGGGVIGDEYMISGLKGIALVRLQLPGQAGTGFHPGGAGAVIAAEGVYLQALCA
jgi:hypothetical protein